MRGNRRQNRRVLVTGATGAVGQPLCRELLERGHTVRGMARRPTPGLTDAIVGDVADRDAVRRAVDGMDTIGHLAAYPDDADFLDVLLDPNVRGLFHVCDAAREFGVERLVLASTVQVIGGRGYRGPTARVADGVSPTNHYALTKVWAEAAAEMYARRHGLSAVSVRIGWLPRDAANARYLNAAAHGPAIYLSPGDAGRFFRCCVESPRPEPSNSLIVFATSRPPGTPVLDIEPARELLGYEPIDQWPEGLPFAFDASPRAPKAG